MYEWYADDSIVHCRTEREALEMRAAIAARLNDYGLEPHPEKTKVGYGKDDDRRGNLRRWIGYCGQCETPSVLQGLEPWLWRRPRFAMPHSAKRDLAAKTAGSGRGP